MRALVLESNQHLVYRENAPDPVAPTVGLGVDQCVRVRVAACGICGSDIPRAFEGKAYHTPLILGHEFSGVVDEDGVEFRRGDRVAVFPLIPPSSGSLVESGDYAQTEGYDYFGSRRDGGMAEWAVVPERNLIRVPDGVPLLHAACTEPAAVALHGVRKLSIVGGESAVVFGAGPIGLLVAQFLRMRGCRPVIVIDIDARKLAVARDLGFATAESAGELSNVQRVVEAVGLPITFLQALRIAAPFGQVVFMGNIAGSFEVGEKDFSSILRRELTIFGTWNSKVVPKGTDDWTTVLQCMPELGLGTMISDTPTLDEGPEIFESIFRKANWHHKVVFRVNPEICG